MAYKEDKQNRLLRVRSEAKNNVRRFVDISFVVNKQSRDRLKMIQRLPHDHYREIAERDRGRSPSPTCRRRRRRWRS